MVQFRKPSSMTYNYTPLQSVRTSIQTRLHALSTKRRIVYGCVGLLILFIFSFMIMGFPDGSSVSSVWTPKVDDTTLTPFPPMDDNSSDSDMGLGSEYPHEHSPQPPSSPPPSALSRPTVERRLKDAEQGSLACHPVQAAERDPHLGHRKQIRSKAG